MATTKSYAPDTMNFLIDQAAYGSNGKKQHNPTPRLRIPSQTRARSAKRRLDLIPLTAPPRVWQTDPVYLLSVPKGQEQEVAAKVSHYTQASGVLIPESRDGLPFMPGSLFVAIPDPVHYVVRERIRVQQWGWLSSNPLDRDTVDPFIPFASISSPTPVAVNAWGVNHPLRQLGEALLHSRGWHGTLQGDVWDLYNAHGSSVPSDEFSALWQALCASWEVHHSIGPVFAAHSDLLEGVAYPIRLTNTPAGRDWECELFGQSGHIPLSEHMFIRPRSANVWGVLTHAGMMTFSLTHPDLLAHRLRYRVPYRGVARVPGQWAAILVPQITDTVTMHVRQTAQSLGWTEPWRAVTTHDPAGLLGQVLKTRRVTFDRHAKQVLVEGIPLDRTAWIPTAQAWLPKWTIVTD